MPTNNPETVAILTQAKQPRINGRQCRPYVQKRKPFRNSNNQLYARWHARGVPYGDSNVGLRYAVYSYGEHWPLHIWDDASQCWYSNKDKHSVTTSRHYTQSHPLCDTVPLSLDAMKVLARHGYAALVQLRLKGNAID